MVKVSGWMVPAQAAQAHLVSGKMIAMRHTGIANEMLQLTQAVFWLERC